MSEQLIVLILFLAVCMFVFVLFIPHKHKFKVVAKYTIFNETGELIADQIVQQCSCGETKTTVVKYHG